MSTTSANVTLFDDEFLKKLEYLNIISKRLFAGQFRAERRTRRRGTGLEFADYRQYVAGDDFRHLDWKAYLRLNKLILKLFEEEEDLPIYFFVDSSQSMSYGNPSKLDYARRVAAALCYIGLANLDRVNVVSFGDGVKGELPPQRGKGRIFKIFRFLTDMTPSGATNARESFKTYCTDTRRRGLAVVISDFFDGHGFSAALDILRHFRHDIFVIHIASHEEMEPTLKGELLLVDSESQISREITITPALLSAYRAEFLRYCEAVESYCGKYQLGYVRTVTDFPFEELVLKVFPARQVLEMKFLALTPLQTALLAIVTAGVVIALYFLKLRHRRVLVSSSILWGRVLDEQQSHSLWEKLRKIISIAVAITIALLIAVSLARPQIESLTGSSERIVIVLDTSPTMNTHTADGQTRWQHAVERAQALLNGGGPTTEFRVVDTSRGTASAFTTDRKEARGLIEQMSPRTAEPRFPKVDAGDSQVFFVSDGATLRDVPSFAKRISVFEVAENAGITAFEIRSMPSTPLGYEAYLEVQNYGKPTDVSITLIGTGGQRINRNVRLSKDGVFKDSFDLSRFAGGGVRATIQSKDDALPIDDVAFAYLPINRKTRTLLVTRGNTYLETLLKLDNYVELTKTDPANYRESTNIDAYIFDRFAPPTPPSRPALIIGAPAAAWLRASTGVVQKPEITTWSEDHPVMQYVSVHDVSIERAARIDASNLTVIAASRQTPLIVASDKPRWVMLTFDLDSSDFPFHVGFPVFVENVLAWFSREKLALHGQPGMVEVPLANAQIRTIDGQPVPSEQQLANTVFVAGEPGLFSATQGDTRIHVAVNLANHAFSDVNRSVFNNDEVVAGQRYWLRRELWFYMLLAAVALIGLEWFTYHRRITL